MDMFPKTQEYYISILNEDMGWAFHDLLRGEKLSETQTAIIADFDEYIAEHKEFYTEQIKDWIRENAPGETPQSIGARFLEKIRRERPVDDLEESFIEMMSIKIIDNYWTDFRDRINETEFATTEQRNILIHEIDALFGPFVKGENEPDDWKNTPKEHRRILVGLMQLILTVPDISDDDQPEGNSMGQKNPIRGLKDKLGDQT